MSRKYNIIPSIQTTSGVVEILPNCNGYIVTNTGDSIVTLKGAITLYPGTPGTNLGDSISIGGNDGEIITERRLQISFTAGGTAPAVQIIQKIYTN